MQSCFIKIKKLALGLLGSFLFISALNLYAHGGGGHGEGGGYHGNSNTAYRSGYDHGYDHGYNHGWENHYDDHNWHHDHWHNNVYVVNPWYSPGFVYSDTSVAYPYYYDGYPYYYYHPAYYWGTGVNVNVNIGE
jgi:hypothetical protein